MSTGKGSNFLSPSAPSNHANVCRSSYDRLEPRPTLAAFMPLPDLGKTEREKCSKSIFIPLSSRDYRHIGHIVARTFGTHVRYRIKEITMGYLSRNNKRHPFIHVEIISPPQVAGIVKGIPLESVRGEAPPRGGHASTDNNVLSPRSARRPPRSPKNGLSEAP